MPLSSLKKLPDGYNTYIGDRGILLSGGQKARACHRKGIDQNPAILVLAETTSALDSNQTVFVLKQ